MRIAFVAEYPATPEMILIAASSALIRMPISVARTPRAADSAI